MQVHGITPPNILHSQISPLSRVNLPGVALEVANIPADAKYFAWCYPFLSDWGADAESEPSSDADVLFVTVGGYVYFDDEFQVIRLNAVLPSPVGGLKFGPPKQWQAAWTAQLPPSRWQPVTLRKLLMAGAMEFCWLRPDEFLGDDDSGVSFSSGKFGAFAYLGKALEID